MACVRHAHQPLGIVLWGLPVGAAPRMCRTELLVALCTLCRLQREWIDARKAVDESRLKYDALALQAEEKVNAMRNRLEV